MIRTEREKARGARQVRRRSRSSRTPTSRSPRSTRCTRRERRRRGAEPRWWEDVEEGDEIGPLVKGPLRVTDMICWHVGMGMGLYGVKALRLGYEQRQQRAALLPPDDLNIPDVQQRVHWDPEWARKAGQPHDLRLRPHARDVAHPPLHRLDGRRRVALEARLRVPAVQLRRRHALDARPRRRASTSPTATGRPSTSTSGARTSAARPPRPGTPRSCCPAASTARCACPTPRTARTDLQADARRGRRPLRADDRDTEEPAVSPYEFLKVERHGHVGWLINNRPDQLNAMNAKMRDEFADAWLELDHDPHVRVIVHTGEGARSRPASTSPRSPPTASACSATSESVENFDLHFTSWHQKVWKPVITAVNGICCRRRLPLGRRRRHRDRRVRRAVLRPARVGRPGRRDRGDRADAQDAGRGGHAHGVRRQVRADDRAACLRARDDQPDRRPARAAARGGAGAGREDRPELTGGDARPPRRRCGARSSIGLTDACRAGAQHLVSMWGHPDQEEGPRAFAEKREPDWDETRAGPYEPGRSEPRGEVAMAKLRHIAEPCG